MSISGHLENVYINKISYTDSIVRTNRSNTYLFFIPAIDVKEIAIHGKGGDENCPNGGLSFECGISVDGSDWNSIKSDTSWEFTSTEDDIKDWALPEWSSSEYTEPFRNAEFST